MEWGDRFDWPDESAPESDGIVRHAADDDDPETIEAMKSRTIRIELGDGDL